jgi:transcriptional regulator with XRE-family HTH domain
MEETIGKRLQRLRLLEGYSHAASFALKLGINKHTYLSYEEDMRRARDWLPIAKELGVSVDYLLTGEGDEKGHTKGEDDRDPQNVP